MRPFVPLKFAAPAAFIFALAAIAPTGAAAAAGADPGQTAQGKAEVTVLYDAFGKSSTMRKDWGFSAFIEYGGKRILFSIPATTPRSLLITCRPRASTSPSSTSP